MKAFSQAMRVWRGLRRPFFLDEPLSIVALEELLRGGANIVDGPVDAAMDDLLLEGLATPLVWGSPTKARLGAMPQNLIWFWKYRP
jgi:hypothetical protein